MSTLWEPMAYGRAVKCQASESRTAVPNIYPADMDRNVQEVSIRRPLQIPVLSLNRNTSPPFSLEGSIVLSAQFSSLLHVACALVKVLVQYMRGAGCAGYCAVIVYLCTGYMWCEFKKYFILVFLVKGYINCVLTKGATCDQPHASKE